MSNTRTLKIDVVADNKKLTKTLRDSENEVNRFGKKLEGLGTGAALGSRGSLGSSAALLKGGGLALGAGVASQKILQLTTAASDLNEQVSKSNVIFGKSAGEIDAWSKTTAKAFGISRTEATAAAATFGALFTGTGESEAAAAKLSKTVVNLAGDLASFSNTSTAEALDALRSGLSGEIEPLRRFQVFLTEAAVAQRAMTETGKQSVTQLTQGEKIQARYALIMEQTTKAQGDAARTSESFANQQRQLAAQTKDLEAKIGTVLLPTLTTLVTDLNKGAGFALALTGALGKLGSVKIPPIHIPLVIDFDGGSAFGLAGDFRDTFGPGGPEKLARLIGGKAKETAKAVADSFNRVFPDSLLQLPTGASHQTEASRKALEKFINESASSPLKSFHPDRRIRFTPEQLNKFFDNDLARSLDRVQDADLRSQVTKLRAIEKTISDRIAATKDITRKLNLEDDLVSVQRQRRGVEEQIGDLLTQRLEDAKAAKIEEKAKALEDLRKRQEAALAKLQARQFKAIGLNATGGDIIPGVENLRKQFASLGDRLNGQQLSSKLKSQFDGVGKILSGSLGKVTEESRSAIEQLFQTIRGTFDKESDKTKGPLTKTHGLDTSKIIQGLGLDPATAAEIRGRLSGFNTAGRSLNKPIASGGFVGGRPIIVENHTTVELDGVTVGKSVTRNQQKARRRNPHQRRGPNVGGV